MTDLVVAQRMAAWGDVARRIAHEVKNPLTPIQLSAERLRRKFGPMVGEERAALEQYADVIVRQTNDLRRIVDEFSKFARMPAPERRPLDLGKLVTEAVVLQESARPDIRYRLELPEPAVLALLDGTMINQAFTNLLKNAAEAIDERLARRRRRSPAGEIRVALAAEPRPAGDRHPGQRHRPARPAGAAVRALRHPPRQGHRPGAAHRQEDHRGARRHARAGAGAALRGQRRPGAWARIVLPQALPEHAGKKTRRARSPRS